MVKCNYSSEGQCVFPCIHTYEMPVTLVPDYHPTFLLLIMLSPRQIRVHFYPQPSSAWSKVYAGKGGIFQIGVAEKKTCSISLKSQTIVPPEPKVTDSEGIFCTLSPLCFADCKVFFFKKMRLVKYQPTFGWFTLSQKKASQSICGLVFSSKWMQGASYLGCIHSIAK